MGLFPSSGKLSCSKLFSVRSSLLGLVSKSMESYLDDGFSVSKRVGLCVPDSSVAGILCSRFELFFCFT